MHWLRTLSPLALILLLLCLAPPTAQAAEAWLPIATYDGAPVPNFEQVSFSTLPVLQDAGAIAVPNEFVNQLGWNPSRVWEVGTPLANVLQLGDVSEAFGLEQLNLGQIAGTASLDLSKLSLSNLQLLQKQTIASLVKAMPSLGNLSLNQVKPILDLVNLKLPTDATWNLANQTIGAIANDNLLGSLSLGELNLDQYSFTNIPGLDQATLSNFSDWQGSAIAGIPGLDKLPFAQFPINPFQIFGLVAIHDVTYGGDGAHKESRQTSTKFSITGSDKVGFNYNCHQAKGCDYIELNAPGYSGSGGMSDLDGLHGARWIRGGKDDGEQMVPGGKGILGKLNDGMEPTGRLSFGKAFKVVLTDTDESTGTGQFGLYFRVCIKKAFFDLGCTPYFIGPIPWLSTHEKGLVFVGLADGTGGMDKLPDGTQLPANIQDQMDQINQENGGGEGSIAPTDLCGSGTGGVDFKALADATSGIEGNYGSVGRWGCDGDGNCGRGLGRYQFMTYRSDIRQAILQQPGGSAFYRQLAGGHEPSSAEMLHYFPTAVQDSLFIKAQTDNINTLQRQGKSGSELIACLGEMWYSGECSHSNGRDYTGGPTVREYGQILANHYQTALKRYGATPCVTAGAKGNGSSGGGGISTGKLTSPVMNAPVTSEFGPRARPCSGCSAYHLGLDFGVPNGTPVKAADGGRVIYSGWMQGYGNTLVIDHGNGLMTLYAHNSQLLAKVGDPVSGGQVVTRSGHSGIGTGAHLHFTVIEGATPGNVRSGHEVDPRKYLKL
jgi:Peptidase family M23